MKILYLLQQFPKMNSETFILNEMIELEKMGHDIWVLSDTTNYYDDLKIHSLITENNFMKKVIGGESYSRGIHKLIDFSKRVTLDFIYYPKPTFKNIKSIFVNNHYYQDNNIWSKLDNYLILRKLPQIKFDVVYSPFAHIEKIDKGISIANIVGAKFTTAFRALELYGYKCRKDIVTYDKIFSGIENIATISEFNKKQLESVLGLNKKISIIHSSIDPERFKPSTKKNINNKTQIITIARFVEKKGIIYLLEALSILKKKDVPFEYTLIGDGPLKDELLKKIKELEIEYVVKIFQPMKQEDVKILLEQSDIMVLPCIIAENGDRDILANVLKESMSMELPVITSDISGIEELITDHQNGLLVPEKNPDALVVAILELINNPELSEKISKAGRQQIINHFNVHEEVKKLSQFFNDVIKSDL